MRPPPLEHPATEPVPDPAVPSTRVDDAGANALAPTLAEPEGVASALAAASAPRSPAGEAAAGAGPRGSGGSSPRVDPDAPSLELGTAASPERYEARAVIGEGGMGEVRLCHDKRIGREVAMKVVRRGHGSRDDLRERFLREARVQGQLEHPAIVPVYDIGVDAAGGTYFTMKRLRGMTFEQIIEALRAGDEAVAQKYSRRKLLSAFGSVCLAVHFAHARGVLHRDLKPANVMLGDFGEVYVLDWGLAKVLGAPEPAGTPAAGSGPRPARAPTGRAAAAAAGVTEAPPPAVSGVADPNTPAGKLTADGSVMGTPGFMSPEQLRGEVDRLDARSDVYALGAMLFELLTLEALHGRSSVGDVLASTLAGADARPSARAPEAGVPPELEAACVRATALDPDARYASARELSDAIERYLDGDRDTEQRRALAQAHARAASEAAERALAEGTPPTDAMAERSRAMAETGRALALDPEAPDAIGTLVRLMSAAPREVPAEVREQIAAAERNTRRVNAGSAAMAYAQGLLLVPLGLWMGVRSWAAVGALLAAFVVAGLYSVRSARGRAGAAMPGMAFVTTSIVALATTTMFGPLLAMPMVVMINLVAYTITVERRRRVAAVATSVATLFLPLGLTALGLLPPAYAFRDGALVVLPGMFALEPAKTVVFLTAYNLTMLLVVGRMVGRFRDELSRAEERVGVFAWQMRQMMPDRARGLAVSRPPAPAWPPRLEQSCRVFAPPP